MDPESFQSSSYIDNLFPVEQGLQNTARNKNQSRPAEMFGCYY
jgi:hypothetical protein